MADISPAKSFSESEEVDIVLSKSLNDEKKLELIGKLKEFPCLWETSSPAYKADKKTKEKAMEELAENFHLDRDGVRSIIHGLRSGLNRELKKETEGKAVRWKFYRALNYMKEDIVKSTKDKEEKEWAPEEVEKLIDYYRDNEEMWNHHLSEYKDRQLKEVHLKSLCTLLPGRTVDDIKKQWTTLKTIFSREVKREDGSKVSGTGTESVYSSSWRYFKSMVFIRGCDDIDPQTSTLDADAENVEPVRPHKKPRPNKVTLAKDMEEAKLELYKEAIKCLRMPVAPVPTTSTPTSVSNDDEITTFLKSVETTLRQFSRRDFARAKKQINDVI